MDTPLGPRIVLVVTPVNPSRVSMAGGSVMGSHLVRPMSSRRATKAVAAAAREVTGRYGTPVAAGTPDAAPVQEPEVIVVPPPPPPPASQRSEKLPM